MYYLGILFDRLSTYWLPNFPNATRNAKRTYWLRGMVFCSEDGRRLVGHFSKGIYRYECPGK